MLRNLTRLSRLGLVAGAAFLADPALSNEQAPAPEPSASEAATAEASAQPAVTARTPSEQNAAEYCSNIADAAADARFQRQVEALRALEKKVEDRVAQLEAKRAEYQDWLERREAFLKNAEDNLVAIYTQMRPDSASQQLAIMNDFTAAAILAKLPPRTASAILNEMDPSRAAQLTNIMAGLANPATNQRKPG
ncbi:MotE family protein [Amorphus sp. 3PC139-8]|uniref:MotE family protein n=1 Tax=Amorphus sp. 3PC139-8 TaxID=2735676 RepID=UPI00345DE96C